MTGLTEIKYDDKKNLVSNLQKVKIKLVPCEDGYLQAYPNYGFLKSLLLKNNLKNIRFKITDYCNEEIVVLEQIRRNSKINMIIGTRYKEQTSTDTLWHKAVGDYEITNFENDIFKMKT